MTISHAKTKYFNRYEDVEGLGKADKKIHVEKDMYPYS